ncbi:F-box/LRR-repeat protein 12-like [Homarus americanus]|uniref:F-box/LRR-repeat protein 12-like n=1 Tax=Homarus americanus TaxID=6706 RepID=A0A8J5MWG0_HOMAM|nr:F-box/LRR-repeat protein 12-like [Homarus americanus]
MCRTCERFNKVASDKSLWTAVDFSEGCLSLQQLKRCHVFLRSTTRQLILRGHKKKYAGTPKWKTPLISAALLKLIGERCPNLEELTLSEAYVDANKLKVTDFLPVQSLTKFCLIDCEFVNLPSPSRDGSYFRRTHKILPRLECLKIIKCAWVDDYDVMVLSKVDSLKKLVLRNLPKVGRAMAYIALSFRFGFQNLEELDVRGTSLEDNEVISIVKNGKLRALYLGPMGPVKRLPEEPPGGYNLIMPDPRWQEERQQVVVINVGPNGPQWRQVNDEELDGMGLQWVRNAPVVQRQRAEEEDEDRHYFIGKDGRPVEAEENDEEEDEEDGDDDSEDDNGAVQEEDKKKQQSSYRSEEAAEQQQGEGQDKLSQAYAEEKEEREGNSLKKNQNKEEDADNLRGDPDDDLQCEAYQVPDECLSDKLVFAFGQTTKHLHTLILSGCAITDVGLQEIIRLVPSLRLLDVTNTKVTNGAVQEARVARPECVILGGGTRVVRQQNNR